MDGKDNAVSQSMNATKIFSTTDYNKFKLMKGNRAVDPRHVQALMKAMEKKDLLIPIAVNSKMEVLDGQHRLEARKNLKLPVPYYWAGDDTGLRDVQALNASQKSWSNKDFCNSYIALGKKDYEIYKWFVETYQFPHVESIKLLMNLTNDRDKGTVLTTIFKSGQFQVRDLSGAKKMAEMMSEIAPYFSRWKHNRFIRAVFSLLPKKNFNWKTFMQKVELNPTMLQPCSNTEQYVELIEKIYNFRAQNKVSLKYGE